MLKLWFLVAFLMCYGNLENQNLMATIPVLRAKQSFQLDAFRVRALSILVDSFLLLVFRKQVPEMLSDVILQKLKAPSKPDDVPDIRPEQLVEADGLIFGFPSRFGMMPSQLKAFFDATGGLWASQALAGKPAGIFWSTGFYGGGQELSA